ncbi:uncharacterized protein LOC123501613 [Portunus trituberculatus]|uniref:uncharacterized protein LOC123501613 n=1 Tax=Portunus trituberculatus TaxID=210409 RepID=UPI001E1D1A2B|nr:uncharacterized protein LOC123501613 [Portunus trituberculatus]
MESRNASTLILVVVALLGFLQGVSAYPLDPNVVAQLQPPKDFFASPFFNAWARIILAGFGFSFLTASGVILAIKRKENKLANLEDYYDQLEEYFAEGPDFFPEDFPDVFPLPNDFPTHDFPFPAELPGPGGWFASDYLRPDDSGFFRRSDDSDGQPPSVSPLRRRRRSIKAPLISPDLQEAIQKALQAEDTQEMVAKTAELVQDVVERLDEDGCLLKLLCRLQEKPKDARIVEEEVLLNLYSLNAPKGSPECGQESHKCFLKESLLEEAFLWGVNAS